MFNRSELKAFYVVIAAVLLIPLTAGTAGAFGGTEALAWLFGVGEPIELPTALRSNYRAICCAFISWVPLTIWSLSALQERAGAFRLIVICAFLAGFARITGWLVEGNPGILPASIMALELLAVPALFFWHARLVRLASRAAPPALGPQ